MHCHVCIAAFPLPLLLTRTGRVCNLLNMELVDTTGCARNAFAPVRPVGECAHVLRLGGAAADLRYCYEQCWPGVLKMDAKWVEANVHVRKIGLRNEAMVPVRLFDRGRQQPGQPPISWHDTDALSWESCFAELCGQPPRARTKPWVLRDVPTAETFPGVPEHLMTMEYCAPDLWEGFSNICPYWEFVLGCRNTNRHLPANMLPAHPFKSYAGSEGSGTPMHCDDEPALNVHAHGAPAVWVIFSAADLPQVEAYIRQRFASVRGSVFRANVFLHQEHLDELAAAPWGCHHWRVVQHPGEVVVLPPGCAHQVLNLGACFKIAADLKPAYMLQQVLNFQQLRRALLDEYGDDDADADMSQVYACAVWAARAACEALRQC
jgi:hypothetical protein